MNSLSATLPAPQLPPPPNFEAFTVRDMTGWYEHSAFDVLYCDPATWRCYYIDDSLVSTRSEAEQFAEAFNMGIKTSLSVQQLISLDS
ncbi:hypothetical protein LPN04_31230 [Rugamonas sp. A1-17]|nr:hypothetical protein [Rugamonas sp. A1-17]